MYFHILGLAFAFTKEIVLFVWKYWEGCQNFVYIDFKNESKSQGKLDAFGQCKILGKVFCQNSRFFAENVKILVGIHGFRVFPNFEGLCALVILIAFIGQLVTYTL